ncbi:hypothetical protein PQR67_32860 [Paraburkholderia fungorum]|uniref:hypothetical protein n=1 Tax=Paraburkholderia fungorum TaxID=134537 RepID=UPI0038B8FA71
MLPSIASWVAGLACHAGRYRYGQCRDGRTERYAVGLSAAAVAAASDCILYTVGSMIAEFTDVAGISEMYGLSRSLTLSIASARLLGATAM